MDIQVVVVRSLRAPIRHQVANFAIVQMDKSCFCMCASVEEELPNARILLWRFHVVKYLHEKIYETMFGLPTKTPAEKQRIRELRANLKGAFNEMLSANSMSNYTKAREFFISLVPTEDCETFVQYFVKNWDARRDLWVLFERQDVAHLGNHTNNRIESSWGHIKPGLS